MSADLAIVGGGPAGLAVAIEARLKGLSATVFERATGPVDKACGEGVMPAGLRALARLGVLQHLDPSETAPIDRLVYTQEDGTTVEGLLPGPAKGIRRLALSRALRERALELGVTLHEGVAVKDHARDQQGVRLMTSDGEARAALLVAADGLHSPIRAREGLAGPQSPSRRFGLRRHFVMEPWSTAVEVHFGPGVEAYVTPAGRARVGIAFLWEDRGGKPSFDGWLSRFPRLAERVKGARFDSEARGAGPLRQAVLGRIRPRLALVGDAAGYVDAITGEGISLALEAAEALGAVLPQAASSGSIEALTGYELAAGRAFNRYARLASTLVFTARHPRLRKTVLRTLAARPALLATALRWAIPTEAEPAVLPAEGQHSASVSHEGR